MRTTLLVGALLALAAAATAESDAHTLIATLKDGRYVWVDAAGAENPTLQVPANRNITIFIQQGVANGAVPHELQVGGGMGSGRIEGPGEGANVTFRSPPAGTIPYICTVHPSTMTGNVQVAGAQESTREGVPGPTLLWLAAVALLAAFARRGLPK